MKIFQRGTTYVMEEDFGSLLKPELIADFVHNGLKEAIKQFSEKYAEEHKHELLTMIDKKNIINLIELEIVKKFISK
jgi:hypothetical protein